MKFCNHCGEAVNVDEKYCSKCGNLIAKKKHMLLYFILMVILFIIFDIISALVYSGTYSIISASKYGNAIILESLWILTILVALVFAGNSYIFTRSRKKVGIWKSLGLALPPVIIALIAFRASFTDALSYNFTDVCGLLIYCITIGIAEELLCRGWLLTEFIERYGYDYKHVKLSILLSAVVFGCMHITNVFYGQTLFETFTQIIQTLGIGFLLGTVFYRTRNIWSVIFIHAFYDFSLMLSDIAPFKVCTGETDSSVHSLIISILLLVIYIVLGEYNLRKTKTYTLLPEVKELTPEDIKETKRSTSRYKAIIIICIFLTILIGYTMPEASVTCSVYPEKELDINYTVKEFHYNEFKLYNELYNYKINAIDGKYYLINQFNDEKVELTSSDNKLLVIQNKEYFVLSYYDKDNKKIVYYKSNYNEAKSFNEIFKIEFEVPDLKTFNTIEFEDGEEYIYFTSDEIHNGMIDSDNNLYEIKFK